MIDYQHINEAMTEAQLCEDRIEQARNRYPDIPQETFDQLVAGQPEGTNNKYLQWMCSMVDQFKTSPSELVTLIKDFAKRGKGEDIYKHKNPAALTSFLMSLQKSNKEVLAADTDDVYEDERWLIVAPHSAKSMQHYGGSTHWCVATSNTAHWNSYYKEQGQTFVVVKDREAEEGTDLWKVAIVCGPDDSVMYGQWYDTDDQRMTDTKKKAYWAKLPKEAQEAIEDYTDSATEGAYDRMGDYEREQAEESWHHGGYTDMIREINRKLDTGMGNTDFQEALEKYMGAEELEQILHRVFEETISYSGIESAGYFHDMKHFWQFVTDSGGDVKKLEAAIDAITNSDSQQLWDLLDLDQTNRLERRFAEDDIEDAMRASGERYVAMRNGEKPKLNSLADAEALLRFGGYHDIADAVHKTELGESKIDDMFTSIGMIDPFAISERIE